MQSNESWFMAALIACETQSCCNNIKMMWNHSQWAPVLCDQSVMHCFARCLHQQTHTTTDSHWKYLCANFVLQSVCVIGENIDSIKQMIITSVKVCVGFWDFRVSRESARESTFASLVSSRVSHSMDADMGIDTLVGMASMVSMGRLQRFCSLMRFPS